MTDVLTGSSTAIGSNNILSLSEVIMPLGNVASITGTLSASLTAMINEISDFIEKKCNRKIVIQELLGTYDGDGTNSLFLRNTPIQSVIAVRIRSSVNNSWEDITSDVDFTVGDHLIFLKTKIFYSGENLVQVHYTGGFSPIPGGIKKVAKEKLQIDVRNSHLPGLGKELLGILSENINTGAGNAYAKQLSNLEEEHDKILKYYRKLY